MVLVGDTVAAAVHAAEKCLIAPSDVPDIRRETDIDHEGKPSADRLASV
jgi:hypothetical protein